ncbi:thiamine-phosphate kinase [Novosphingobium sp. FSY-8]|uniref:Thiamine-monophosphate kinase n=1 Tax=Novosphingobium ovatum TaxID=1908523 RepID=A0ABW9XAX6_9SPHN|nr:thiamine-phosphate kinase [Novosphingobium ovatum]NBC35662.1 thiamine-phosphate kinase [Novosphingobium ovatum]
MSAELDFIAALRALAGDPAARGLRDDCAVLPFGGQTLVLTHDTIVAGVHFLPDMDPADIAWRLVATNISDLAAKGAAPVGVLLAYQLNGAEARFLEGLRAALAEYGAPLLGGDTVGMPDGAAQTLGLTAIGRATHTPVPGRDGAALGDILYITGPVGGAMIGLEALRGGDNGAASAAYRRPQAQLAAGIALAPHVGAMMDVSDGVLLDAARMATASRVTIAIDSAAVPIAAPEPRRAEALRWGDDYHLLFTAAPDVVLPVHAHAIGRVIAAGKAPILLDGAPLSLGDDLGFAHG